MSTELKTKAEQLNELFTTYGLYYDPKNPDSKDNDVFVHRHYKIITRAGIQKIEKALDIKCVFTPIAVGENFCYLSVVGTLPNGRSYQTLASASDGTHKGSPYWPEMAEKRARSRVVLTLAGLYEQGVFGEDEADDFARGAEPKTATYKGK